MMNNIQKNEELTSLLSSVFIKDIDMFLENNPAILDYDVYELASIITDLMEQKRSYQYTIAKLLEI